MVELVRLHKKTIYGQRNGLLIPVITDGLVAYYPITQGGGNNLYDESKTGNDGTVNGPTWIWTPGNVGRALDFDGSDDYVEVPDDASFDFSNTDSFTMAAWFKIATTGTSKGILGRYGYQGYEMRISGSDEPIYSVNDVLDNTIPVTVEAGVWYHLTVVIDASDDTGYGYVNGGLEATHDLSGWSDPRDAHLIIGARSLDNIIPGLYEPFNGTIDEVRIYDRALSAEEINNIYQKTRGFYGV